MPTRSPRLDRTGFLLAVAANVLGGATYFATKKALVGIPPVTLSLVRTVVALAILFPLAGRTALLALARAGGRTRWQLLAMGVLGYAFPLTLGNLGVERSTATSGALLIGTEPLATVLLAALFLGETVTRARGIAIVLGLLGATLIVTNGIPFVTWSAAPHLVGDLLLVAHGAAWAIWSIAGKPLLGRHPALAVSCLALAVAVPALLPGVALEWSDLRFDAGVFGPLAWAVALGALVSALGTVLWNAALRRMEASQIAGFIFLQPVVGAVLGIVLLAERPTGWAIAGGVLVFFGVYALAAER